MAGLIFRRDGIENVLRSVGDAPNGIVGSSFPDGIATISVDPIFQPSQRPVGVVAAKGFADGIGPAATAITVEEAVEACADDAALDSLLSITATTLLATSPVYLANYCFDEIRSAVDLCEAIALAVDERRRNERSESDG